QDLLSIGYVHPLIVAIFCIWGVGRAAGALAGEVDRGTMELLLAQPLSRARLILAHLLVDAITIPILCLSLWAGNGVGVWLIGPQVKVNPIDVRKLEGDGEGGMKKLTYLVELQSLEFGPLKTGPFRVSVQAPPGLRGAPIAEASDRLRVTALAFG